MCEERSTWKLKTMDEIETEEEVVSPEESVESVEVSQSMARCDPVFDLTRYSHLHRALRVVARAANFIRNSCAGEKEQKYQY